MYYGYALDIPGFSRQEADPTQEYPFSWHSHSSHFSIPRRTVTFRWLNIYPCGDRSPYILRLSSLPFCEREKIPHQFIFHLQLLDSCFLPSQLVAKIGKLVFFGYHTILCWSTFFLIAIPAAILRSFSRARCMYDFICALLNPNFSPICLWLYPCFWSSDISWAYCSICLYSLGIKIPPMVDIFLFYHRRVFFSIVRF